MMDFLRKCFKTFRVAFWGIKNSLCMEEVLRKILPLLEHLEGHKPIYLWSRKDCEIIQKYDEVIYGGDL